MQSKNLKSEIGNTYGSWRVIGRAPNYDERAYWFCLCKCGVVKSISGSSMRKGMSNGCNKCKPVNINTNWIENFRLRHSRQTHGMSKTNEYRIWRGILSRCLNANNPNFHLYGGRGIEVCSEWSDSFEEFYRDMGKRPSTKHSIDRIDTNGNYCKENCRWATAEIQSRNRRNNQHETIGGITYVRSDWMKMLEVDPSSVHKRIRKGETFAHAIAALRPNQLSVYLNSQYPQGA